MTSVPAYYFLQVLIDSMEDDEVDVECLFVRVFDALMRHLFEVIPAGSYPEVRWMLDIYDGTFPCGRVKIKMLVPSSERLFRVDENWERSEIDFDDVFEPCRGQTNRDIDKLPGYLHALNMRIRGSVNDTAVVEIYCSPSHDEIIFEIL